MRNYLKLSFWGLFAVSAVCGCASAPRMTTEQLGQLKVQPVIYSIAYTPSVFRAELSGGNGFLRLAGYGDLVDMARRQEGRSLMSMYELPDPASELQRQFMEKLAENHDMKQLRIVHEPHRIEDFKPLRKKYKNGHILDFQTAGWFLGPGKKGYAHFYGALARLINTETAKVIWEGECTVEQTDYPTLEQLRADSGRLIKKKIDDAVAACAGQMVAQFFDVKK